MPCREWMVPAARTRPAAGTFGTGEGTSGRARSGCPAPARPSHPPRSCISPVSTVWGYALLPASHTLQSACVPSWRHACGGNEGVRQEQLPVLGLGTSPGATLGTELTQLQRRAEHACQEATGRQGSHKRLCPHQGRTLLLHKHAETWGLISGAAVPSCSGAPAGAGSTAPSPHGPASGAANHSVPFNTEPSDVPFV